MSALKTAGESFLKEKNHFLNQIIHLEQNTKNYSEEQLKTHALWLLKDLVEKTKYLLSSEEEPEVFDNQTIDTKNIFAFSKKTNRAGRGCCLGKTERYH